jgi:hypothetical protein
VSNRRRRKKAVQLSGKNLMISKKKSDKMNQQSALLSSYNKYQSVRRVKRKAKLGELQLPFFR